MHKLFEDQIESSRNKVGELDMKALAKLVGKSYAEFDVDREQTERSMSLMVEELDQLNSSLESQVEERTVELVQRREELKTKNALFEAALEHMTNGLCVFSADLRLVVCNKRYLEMYKLPPELGTPGTLLDEIIAYRTEERLFEGTDPGEDIKLHIAREQSANRADLEYRLTNGHVYSVAYQPIPGGGWVTTHDDITKLHAVQAELAHLAYHDPLTGLPNRSLLRQRLIEAVSPDRATKPFSILFVDLDGFKSVNDTLGHASGDELLCLVAERLKSCVRKNDTIGRMGGDEFAILLRAIDPSQATKVAERVLEELKKPFMVHDQEVAIDSSVGIASSPIDGTDPEALLQRADLALYAVKNNGRGAYRFFEEEMDHRMRDRRQMETDLRLALDRGEFSLHYQPLLNIAQQKTTGVEVLLRWNHPTRGAVSPAEFIPVAEDVGLIVPIGEWVIHEAFSRAASWPENLSIAVNVSTIQLRRVDMAQIVTEALARTGMKAGRVEIEITESAFLENDEQTLNTLHALRELGVKIVLDDFGTGYSALSYLLNFPFDKIKIDGTFVRSLSSDNGHGAKEILSAMAYLGQQLGMRTTAECIETEEDLRLVEINGYTEAQGYFICRPLPADDIERFLGLRDTEEEQEEPLKEGESA